MAYLARSPIENVFLSWTISSRGQPAIRESIYVCARGSSITGIGYFGRQIVLAADGDDAIRRLADVQYTDQRMIVAPRRVVEPYWQLVQSRHRAPRLVRTSQPLLAVDRKTLKGNANGVTVRQARTTEWQAVADNSAAMTADELGYDPRSDYSGFDAGVRASIAHGTWWVGERDGRLCFFTNAGPHNDQTLQLQAIWTPPELRRQGLASAALYGICDRLLRDVPTLSLYVNDFNTPALGLYARLGFTQAGEFSTLLF